MRLEGLPDDPSAAKATEELLAVLRSALALFFPMLGQTAAT